MNSAAVEWIKLIGAFLGLLAAVFLAYCKVRDAKDRKHEKALQEKFGLADNPTRCGEHQARIESLRSDVDDLKDNNRHEHDEMARQLRGISLELVGIKKDIEHLGGTLA